MNSLITDFDDSSNSGRITLYANPFKNGSHYYGRFERNTVNTNNLIARIQKKQAGTNELQLQASLGFIKEEILTALSKGEAVNILDLGIMYIVPNGTYNGTDFDVPDGEAKLLVKFTPSAIAKKTVENIEIKEIRISDSVIAITGITDQFTGKTDNTVSIGKSVLLTGKKLKTGGENSGIFLCPLTEKEEISEDETTWISCPVITRNTNMNLEFYIPETAVSGQKYRILIRSFLSGNKSTKTAKEAVSDIVTVN